MVILSMYFVTTPSLRGLKIASHDEVSPHTRSVRFVLKICVHTPINRVPPAVHPNVGSEPFVLVNAGFGANGTKLLVLNVSLLKLTNTMGIEENNCHNYDRLKRQGVPEQSLLPPIACAANENGLHRHNVLDDIFRVC